MQRHGRITATIAAAAATAAMTTAVAPVAEAGPHQVKYTVTADRDFQGNILFIQNEPPSKAAYDADANSYIGRTSVHVAPDNPFVFDTTLNDPTQWAFVSVSAASKAIGSAVFHCEIAVDGVVVTQQDGETAVQCAQRAW